MPVETIKCQECGSADVTEFKAGTYICGHCEAVFKHIDPSRVTVQREFCECGGAIAFQCRVCHTGICQAHDALRCLPAITVRDPTDGPLDPDHSPCVPPFRREDQGVVRCVARRLLHP